MNEFAFDELLDLIQLSQALTDTEKKEWRIRVFSEYKELDGLLSDKTRDELDKLFEAEMGLLDSEIEVLEGEYKEAVTNERQSFNEIRPDLEHLLEDYNGGTDDLLDQYEEAFLLLDKEYDSTVKSLKEESDESEADLIRQKLKANPDTK
jgi:hypothetical protein